MRDAHLYMSSEQFFAPKTQMEAVHAVHVEARGPHGAPLLFKEEPATRVPHPHMQPMHGVQLTHDEMVKML